MPICISIYDRDNRLSPPVEYENALWRLSPKEDTRCRKTDLLVQCRMIDENQAWEYDVALKLIVDDESEPKTIRRKLTKWDNYAPIFTVNNSESMLRSLKIEIDVKIKNLFTTNVKDEFLSATPHISDARLIIDGTTLHVCKKILAQSSTYFYELFYEKHVDQDEFPIEDVAVKDFLQFLAFLYNRNLTVSHELHGTLAELSKRFQSVQCLEKCEKQLIKFHNMAPEEKLRRAQGYEFPVLKEYVLKQLTRPEIIDIEKNLPDCFGPETKLIMFDQICALHRRTMRYQIEVPIEAIEHTEHIDGIPFKITRNEGSYTIECNVHDTSNPWRCLIFMKQEDIPYDDYHRPEGKESFYKLHGVSFDCLNPKNTIPRYPADNNRILVVYLVGIFPERFINFSEPRENLTDVILLVEDKKFHVSKQILADASSYFYSMFFSEFAEKNKTEIELQGVEAIEFGELLQHIYNPDRNVTYKTIESLLRLSQMFDIPTIFKKCKENLTLDISFDETMKAELAKEYDFSDILESIDREVKASQERASIKFIRSAAFRYDRPSRRQPEGEEEQEIREENELEVRNANEDERLARIIARAEDRIVRQQIELDEQFARRLAGEM